MTGQDWVALYYFGSILVALVVMGVMEIVKAAA